jgi:hypothetical protein
MAEAAPPKGDDLVSFCMPDTNALSQGASFVGDAFKIALDHLTGTTWLDSTVTGDKTFKQRWAHQEAFLSFMRPTTWLLNLAVFASRAALSSPAGRT